MSSIFSFKNFNGSSRGLLARILLPNNQVALQEDIGNIAYEVKNITDDLPSETGALVVAEVMYAALQPWHKDSIGHSFYWPFEGDLIPLANKKYRFVLLFTIKNDHAVASLQGKSFKIAYQADTKDPLA
jgi:hypothetical protein